MQVIIHIGQHKTGTTAFQHYLKDSRNSLLQQGFYYPLPLAGFESPSHFVLNLCALDDNRFSPMKDALIRKGAFDLAHLNENLSADIRNHYLTAMSLGCHTMIFSNEGLYLLNSEAEYLRLKQMFNFANHISCYCSFRELTGYRNSYTKQLQKQKIALSQDKASYAYVEEDSWLFDYAAKRKMLEHCFSSTVFVDYSKETAVSDLCSAMGIKVLPDLIKRLNVTS